MHETQVVNYIMAGGEGVRLRPLTDGDRPKPLLPVGQFSTCIDFTLDQTIKEDIIPIVAGGYGFEKVKEYLDGKSFQGLLVQDRGIIGFGSLIQHLDTIEGTDPDFIIVSPADHVHYLDYNSLIDFHITSEAQATVVAIEPTSDPNHLIAITENNQVTSYNQYPQPIGRLLQAIGIYCFDGTYLINQLKKRRDLYTYDITEQFKKVVAYMGAFAYEYIGHWRDIGTFDRYYEENIRLKGDSKNVMIGENIIAGDADVDACVLLGHVEIEGGCVLRDSIIMEGTKIPRGVFVGFDKDEDRSRAVIVTPKGRRVITFESSLERYE